jgi:hypothetical protein
VALEGVEARAHLARDVLARGLRDEPLLRLEPFRRQDFPGFNRLE